MVALRTRVARLAGWAVVAGAVGLAPALVAPATAAELVADGGFEGAGAAGNSPSWTEADSVFGTPLCDASCGGVGPHAGGHWAWFGGTEDASTASLTQSVTLPAGAASLSFYLWRSAAPPPATATLTVRIDSTVVHTFAAVIDAAWTLQTFDISPLADGGSHTLGFFYDNSGSIGSTNFHMDDVSITSTATAPPTPAPTPAPAPETTLVKTPKHKVKTGKRKARVSFAFSSSTVGATFQCSIDGRAFHGCTSGFSFRAKVGRHTFAVRALAAGVADPSPATYSFRVKRRHRH